MSRVWLGILLRLRNDICYDDTLSKRNSKMLFYKVNFTKRHNIFLGILSKNAEDVCCVKFFHRRIIGITKSGIKMSLI